MSEVLSLTSLLGYMARGRSLAGERREEKPRERCSSLRVDDHDGEQRRTGRDDVHAEDVVATPVRPEFRDSTPFEPTRLTAAERRSYRTSGPRGHPLRILRSRLWLSAPRSSVSFRLVHALPIETEGSRHENSVF